MAATPRLGNPAETVAAVEWWHFSDVEVVRVIDGDTVAFRVNVDIGFHVKASAEVVVRLDGLNCPEKTDPMGMEATIFTTGWLLRNKGKIELATRKSREKYGRWLGTIRAGQECLNDDLINEGYARPYHGERRI
ncbi:thermonuclease family protein [Microbispora sp. NPDC049633]|uniref:thermonuclease family protein n=1 Tax=Microbispora sp. NPDC049633 TaxID=3154355 RepID=UPI00341C54BE